MELADRFAFGLSLTTACYLIGHIVAHAYRLAHP